MIIADTGFWLALLDRRDNLHTAAKLCAMQLKEPLITTVPVITEVCYLLQQRSGSKSAAQFLLAQQDGLYSIFNIERTALTRCANLMLKYENLPMDFADASLVVLAEHLEHGRIVSSDLRDFSIYRWNECNQFYNLFNW